LHRVPEHRAGHRGRGRRDAWRNVGPGSERDAGGGGMTITEDRPTGEVGAPRRRKEDARLITGRTNWTDNIVLPGMLYMAILRSPVAHARLTRVDVSGARS